MKVHLASVSERRLATKDSWMDQGAQEYQRRASRYHDVESARFESEKQMLLAGARYAGRTAAQMVLFDARGEVASSEEFARYFGQWRDRGVQHILLGIGPADGWSEEAHARADKVLSLGRMTLPHQLARVVVAEQVYRAFTILAGHPYHLGH